MTQLDYPSLYYQVLSLQIIIPWFWVSQVTALRKLISSILFSRSVMSSSFNPMGGSTPSFPVYHQLSNLLKLMSIKSVIPSNHLILCHSLLPPSIFPSITAFSNDSVLHVRWLKYWSFSISHYNTYSGLISSRNDWLDLLAGQKTIKSLHQHCCLKASMLQQSTFFIVQLSHPYMTTEKNIVLTRQNLVGKVMSLLFNMLSRLVIAFLPRSKCLLISWLQSPSLVIWGLPNIKSVTVSIVSPSICHEVMGLDTMILIFWMLSFKSTFTLPFFTFIKRLFSSSSLSAIRVVSSAYLRLCFS